MTQLPKQQYNNRTPSAPKEKKKKRFFLMTLCLYTHTRIESYLTSSASCTHVQDNKDTIRSPKSSAILGPKKKKKSSIYKGKKKNKGKFFSFYPITQRSTPPALESSAFPTVLCYFPPHPPSLSTSGPS